MPEDDGPGYSDLSAPKRQPRNGKSAHIVEGSPESGCNVRTQDPENFDEEVKSLVTAWQSSLHMARRLQDMLFTVVFAWQSSLHMARRSPRTGLPTEKKEYSPCPGNPSQQPENEEPKSWLELISTEERNSALLRRG